MKGLDIEKHSQELKRAFCPILYFPASFYCLLPRNLLTAYYATDNKDRSYSAVPSSQMRDVLYLTDRSWPKCQAGVFDTRCIIFSWLEA